MFDGMPDQFYQFLASTNNNNNTFTTSTQTVPPLPLSFQQQQQQPIFDAAYLFHYQQQQQQPQQHCTQNETKGCILAQDTEVPWSNEEVLALLKIRSTLESNPWFPPEFTWDNVSRKLEEIGFKRNAENCKDKFEEETRSFNTNNIVINSHKSNVISQNYRLFGELEELYNCNDDHEDDTNNNNQMDDHSGDPRSMSLCMKNQIHDNTRNDNEGEIREIVGHEMRQENSEGSGETGERGRDDDIVDIDNEKLEESTKEVVGRKRKRYKKFALFKGFYENIVNKMMEQQEEFHCKVIEDMVKRDEEKIAREEAWKKHEIDVITKELEVRAHEQAIVGDRQAKLLGFLSKFSSLSSTNLVENELINDKVPKNNASLVSTSSSLLSQDCVSATTHDQSPMSNLVTQQKCNLPISLSKENLGLQNPNPNPSNQYDVPTCKAIEFNHTSTDAPGQVVMDYKSPKNQIPSSTMLESSVKDDTSRRWPRDEVLALINIRCSLFNNNCGDNHDKEIFSKGPLWERVSQKMLELGYKRSSKRCKEKWENINKYFRKTKDLNKKRSIDSRTCPYFQQLSHLYNSQGPPHDHPKNLQESPPENQSKVLSDGQGGSSTSNAPTTTTCTLHGNEGSVVQMSAEFGFEF